MQIKVDKRSHTSETQYHSRLQSVLHLVHASKDINNWEFKQYGRPSWAPLSCHHVYQARCKTSGIKQEWLIDRVDADEHGNFEPRHREIIEFFTQSLLYLDSYVQEVKRRRELGQKGFVLPDGGIDLESLAKKALHRGDHPNDLV